MHQRRSQAAFLASALSLTVLLVVGLVSEVRSVVYTGEAVVRPGQAWNITCSKIPPEFVDKVQWKRNGQELLTDLSTGVMQVEAAIRESGGTFTSTLIAKTTLERHEGSYTCLDITNDTHYVSVVYDITLKLLTKPDILVVLDCPDAVDGDWTKEGKPFLESDFVKEYKNGSVVVSYSVENDIYGNYTCKVGNQTANYRVVRKPILHMQTSTNVVEGEKLHLICQVTAGDAGLKIIWNVDKKNYTSSSGRIELRKDEEKNINNGILHIEQANMDDRGNYTCYALYNVTDNTPNHFGIAATYVRIKDKYAALWPFLGIVAEVAVLCAIILIYEKKRNKSELEESDTDQSPDTKPTPNKDTADVRQRK